MPRGVDHSSRARGAQANTTTLLILWVQKASRYGRWITGDTEDRRAKGTHRQFQGLYKRSSLPRRSRRWKKICIKYFFSVTALED